MTTRKTGIATLVTNAAPGSTQKAGIAEYWIVDPKTETILVLVLDGAEYLIHGEYSPGMRGNVLVLLPTFAVDVAAVFDAGSKRVLNS